MAHDSITTEPGGTWNGDIVAGGITGGGGAGGPRVSDPAGGATGSPGGLTRGYHTAWWEQKLEEERNMRRDMVLAYEARVTELLDENNKLLQRARDAEAQAVRWFNMSKDLLAVAGEFAKLMAKP